MNFRVQSSRPDAIDAGLVSQLLREAARSVGLCAYSPDDIIPRHNDSVYFTSAAICRFMNQLLESGEPPRAFVEQWCFRTRNLSNLRLGSEPEWSSVFRQFGAISGVTDLAKLLKAASGALLWLSKQNGAQLGANVASRDQDILAAMSAVISHIDLDCESPAYYIHRYGSARLSGRSANFKIRVPGGPWRDVGNLVVIQRDGHGFAVEIAIGLETTASAVAGLRSSIFALPSYTDEMRRASRSCLAIVDLANTISHLSLSGLRPFSTCRGRLFRAHAHAFANICARNMVDPKTILIMTHLALESWYGDQPRRCNQLIDYVHDVVTLAASTIAETNERLARKWAPMWL